MPTIRPDIVTDKLLSEKPELYSLIDEGLNQVERGMVKNMKKSIKRIRASLGRIY